MRDEAISLRRGRSTSDVVGLTSRSRTSCTFVKIGDARNVFVRARGASLDEKSINLSP